MNLNKPRTISACDSHFFSIDVLRACELGLPESRTKCH